MSRQTVLFVGVVVALALSSPLGAQEPAPKPRRAVVTFEGKLEALPALTPEDFQVEAGKQTTLPTRLYDPDDLPTLIAIVLQDNQTPEFGTQLPALRDFILAQPPNTYVGLFYLTAQSIDPAVYFDSDLQKVAAALRTPKGQRELAPPNPYEPLVRIITYMYQLPDARKEVLLFSEGSDALGADSTPGQNRNLQQAVQAAQQAGIPVWAIYSEAFRPESRMRRVDDTTITPTQVPAEAPSGPPSIQQQLGIGGGSDAFADSPFAARVQYGVSYLNYLTEHSGGKLFSGGKFATDIRPYLEEFRRLLSQQYVLELPGNEPPKKIKLNRKLGGVKLLYPQR